MQTYDPKSMLCKIDKRNTTFFISGEDFAVFRKSNGKVHVVNAYCPHLGANMGVGGIVKDDCLQCPFHGWRFDGDTGKCKSIPYTDKGKCITELNTWFKPPSLISLNIGNLFILLP